MVGSLHQGLHHVHKVLSHMFDVHIVCWQMQRKAAETNSVRSRGSLFFLQAEGWNDLVKFLQELCGLARHTQPGARAELLNQLVNLGLFEVWSRKYRLILLSKHLSRFASAQLFGAVMHAQLAILCTQAFEVLS